jgi:curved DNA-binding protein CbpA
MKNYYQLLGIEPSAGQEEIKRAFRKMASLYHPDHNPKDAEKAEEMFKAINEAYEVLGDEGKRRQYDRLIRPRRPGSREVIMEDFINWRVSGSDIMEELLREFGFRTVIFEERPRPRWGGCGRGRGRRCRRFYSEEET